MDSRKGGRILVVGGGPAGCAAAITLLRKGFEVTLFESGGTGRDKVCGDGFLADSQKAMKKLGVFEEFREHALEILGLISFGYRNKKVNIDLSLYTLQRARFDQIMRDKVASLGGEVLHDSPVERARTSPSRASVSCGGKSWSGDCIVLATGSRTRLARQLGFTIPRHSAVAMRAYAPNNIGLDRIVTWGNEKISPAYGWVFPVPGNQLNVGIGYHRGYKPKENLKNLMDEFLETLSANGMTVRLESVPKAWMLRAGLLSAEMSGERVVLAGENIHTTHDFTGEGVGKALWSGILAGEAIAGASGDYSAGSMRSYDARILSEFSGFHAGYRRASRMLNSNAFNFVFTHLLAHSGRARRIFSEIMEEKRKPEELFSLKGIIRILIYG